MPLEVLENLEYIHEDYSIYVPGVSASSTQGQYTLKLNVKGGHILAQTPQVIIAPGYQVTTVNVVLQEDGSVGLQDYWDNLVIGTGDLLLENETKVFEVHFLEFPNGELVDMNNLGSYSSQNLGNSFAKKKTRTINYTRTNQRGPMEQVFNSIFKWLRNLFKPQKR